MKKATLNENALAIEITKNEGLKEEVNIAQVKEIVKVTFSLLANRYSLREIARVLRKHRRT